MADLASDHLAQQDAARTAAIRARAARRELQPLGQCHWCECLLPAHLDALFCDSDCRDDWHKAERARAQRPHQQELQ